MAHDAISGNAAASAALEDALLQCGIDPSDLPHPKPEAPGQTGTPKKQKPKQPTIFNAADLLRTEFPEPSFLHPGILPDEGCYLLCGKPKGGKSWYALNLAMASAQAGIFLDREVSKRKVLYLALEDTPRRLKRRMIKLQPDGEQDPNALSDLTIWTEAPRLGCGLEKRIEAAIQDGFNFIIVDTLQKVRAPAGKNGSQYSDDYSAIGAIKELADKYGILILIIHHVRKAESADAQDDISGTNGIAGAADGALILRRIHGKKDAVLYTAGRDMDESEFGLHFDSGIWTYVGTAAEVQASAEQAEILNALKPYGVSGATAVQICDDLGKARRNVNKLLSKLVDSGAVVRTNSKPAPTYHIGLDGKKKSGGLESTSGSHTHTHDDDERVCGNENAKMSSSGSSGSKGSNGSNGSSPEPGTPSTAIPNPGTQIDQPGTAGTLDDEPSSRPGSQINSGSSGTPRTAGTAGTHFDQSATRASLIQSPVAKQILACLSGDLAGMPEESLIGACGGKAGAALVKEAIGALLLAGQINRVDGRLVGRHG